MKKLRLGNPATEDTLGAKFSNELNKGLEIRQQFLESGKLEATLRIGQGNGARKIAEILFHGIGHTTQAGKPIVFVRASHPDDNEVTLKLYNVQQVAKQAHEPKNRAIAAQVEQWINPNWSLTNY